MRPKPAVLTVLCLAAFIISVDVTIVNVALPTLVRSLGSSTSQLQWVVDSYSLVFAALVLAAGSLGDRFGRKGTLLVGLAVFAASSLVGAFTTTNAELIVSRAAMGLGAALMFPATLSLLVNIFTERNERALAIGLWGATTGVGIAMGPIVGGWLLERMWWGSIFVFLAGVAAVVTGLVALAVSTSRDPAAPPLDWLGLVISSAGMAALVFGVIEAPSWGWGSPSTVAVIAVGITLLVALVAVETRRPHPMLDVTLFRNLRFTAASGSVAISFFALQGFIFLVTQYFQFVKNFSPLSTGVRLLPVASSVAITSVVGTKLAVRLGNKAVVSAGLILFATGLLLAATNYASTSYLVIVGQMIFLGAGMGFTSAPATEAIMGAVSEAKAGVGSAVNDATRLFGGTLGVAIIGSVAASLYRTRLDATLPTGLPSAALHGARGSIGGATVASQLLTEHGQVQAGRALMHPATAAFLHSFHGGCLVAAGVALAGAGLAAAFLPARPTEDHPAETRPTEDHPTEDRRSNLNDQWSSSELPKIPAP